MTTKQNSGMKDSKGCSVCKPGEEKYESYVSSIDGKQYIHYEYRAMSGELFSTITTSLEMARKKMDEWRAPLICIKARSAKKDCNHDPRLLAGKPLGMYHCPECGEMVIAGFPHPEPE